MKTSSQHAIHSGRCRLRQRLHLLAAAAAAWCAAGAGPAARAADFPPGLVLQFNFEEVAPGGVIADRTGRGLHGRLKDAQRTADGRLGGGCAFGAAESGLIVTNAPPLNRTQATFAVWFKTTKPAAFDRSLLDKRPDRGYALVLAGDASNGPARGRLRFTVSGHACLSDSNVADGVWHHVAASYDGENLKLYVDGQLQKQVTAWHGAIPANDDDLVIGLNRNPLRPEDKGKSFDGAVDELMIFDHALSAADVGAVLAAARPRFTKDQVARRLAELKDLHDRGLLLDDFYERKVKECEAGL
jgi:hypothetical protein